MKRAVQHLRRIDVAKPSPFRLHPIFKRPIERLLLLDKLADFYGQFNRTPDASLLLKRALEALDVSVKVTSYDLSRVPRSGPLVVVANHPFGALEGMVLTSALCSLRSDVRVLANSLLSRFQQLDELLIHVDPFGGENSTESNLKGMRRAIRWLKSGGVLVVFPAGEVSHLDVRLRAVTDSPWTDAIARLVRLTGAATLPVFFEGSNGMIFQLAGLLHARLRT